MSSNRQPEVIWLGEDAGEASLVDLVDHVLEQGVVLTGEIMLGLAGVDLVYLRLDLLLGPADRLLPAPHNPDAPETTH